MKQVILIAVLLFCCQSLFSQDYANDENYFLIVLDGENAYINKNTGEVVKPGQKPQQQTIQQSKSQTTVLNPVKSNSGYHVVKKGQTLYSISRKYGVSVSSLKSANGLTNYSVLSIGQELTIPNGNAVSVKESVYVNSASSYTIQKGDTLYSIARRFGKTVAEIKSANNLSSNMIQPGQTITIR